MIFFVAMTFVIGLMNFALPLQLGVRDVAFPTLNSVSFWLTASGVLLVNASLLIGEFSQAGWMGYPPLSELAFSPGVGVDYYLWSLQISGIGTLLTGVNFVTTILKIRAPGMIYMRMPVFCWTALAANLLIVAAFPVLTATFAMLLLDRYLGFHFFTTDMGGNAMLYVNLFWVWGHPEVYILILPAFGVFSEVVSTFSGKPLYGYRSMVAATLAICILSFTVWLHHFFTMGAGANVNAVFGIMSMLIAIPTGVKIFNWLFTMWGGRVRFETPMLWAIAFMLTFAIGGMTGVLLAVPPADFVLHNSLFLIAHFHNVIIGGVLFGVFAGYTYWFPKAFGFKLEKRFGTAAFWFWVTGFYVTFMPLYVVGLEGMTRRMQHYDVAEWRPWLLVSAGGSVLVLCGIACQIAQIVVSVRERVALRDHTGDAWDGRTLEWMTASPPPAFNFAAMPNVTGEEAYWGIKQRAIARAELTPLPHYEAIEMPINSPTGFVVAFFAVITGFSLIWHIFWLAAVGVAGAFATFVVFAWRDHEDYEVPVEEVARIDARRREAREDLVAGREPGIRLVRVVKGTIRSATASPIRAAATPGQRRSALSPPTDLDFPAVRLRDVFGLLRDLCGAVAQHGRRAGAPRALQPEDGRRRDGVPFAVELRLRPRDDRGRRAKHAVDPGPLCGDRPARPRVPRPRAQRVLQDDRGRLRPPTQRVSVGLLRARRLSRPARHHRTALARHDDGADLHQGFPAEHHASHPVLRPLLARARHHLDRHLHQRLPSGNADMSDHHTRDSAPGEGGDFGEHSISEAVRNYLIGLVLASALTIASFWVASGTRSALRAGAS